MNKRGKTAFRGLLYLDICDKIATDLFIVEAVLDAICKRGDKNAAASITAYAYSV